MGEPAGIGGEIILKAWNTYRRSLPPLFVIDDRNRLQKLLGQLNLNMDLVEFDPANPGLYENGSRLPVLHAPLPAEQKPGQLISANAAAVVDSIAKAVALTQAGQASGIVTNPIHKSALYETGFSFPGHTEYLASLTTPAATPVMMLACEHLRVVPVSIHVSLRDAVNTLTTDSIIAQSVITANALRRDFGISTPRLAIAGLNPHAGEAGAMGSEEQTIITPAITALKNRGINASGPYPPDTLFAARSRNTYDVAICMYHDQALIPIKTLDFDGGVNITLGLDFIRTSPDHGTALDIAGTGQASETSLVAAIQMAARLAIHRQEYDSRSDA